MHDSVFCVRCETNQNVLEFKGHKSVCRLCRNEDQKRRRNSSGNGATKRYEKTKNGYLMRTYRNMKSRVKGILKKKAHLYSGLEILDREDFYAWAKASSEFERLFKEWVASDYNSRLSPSIDRVDSSVGYILENMRWLPHWENSQLGSQAKARKLDNL